MKRSFSRPLQHGRCQRRQVLQSLRGLLWGGEVGFYYQDRSNPFKIRVCNKCGVFFAAQTHAMRVDAKRTPNHRYARCLDLGMLPERVGIREQNNRTDALVMLATVASRALLLSKTVHPQRNHASQKHACGHHSYDEGPNDVFL
jgi:hypothetical protein